MVSLLTFVAFYLACCAMAFAIARRLRLDAELFARSRGALPAELTLPPLADGSAIGDPTSGESAPIGRPIAPNALAFLAAFGWSCARASRTGSEVKRLLLFLSNDLEFHSVPIPRNVRADITRHLGRLLQQDRDAGPIAIGVYERCLGTDPSLMLFLDLLHAYHHGNRFADIVALWQRRPDLARAISDAACQPQAHGPLAQDRAVHALEVSLCAHIRADAFDPIALEREALFLLEHTTETYVTRPAIAHGLVAHIDRVRDKEEVVRSIERLIPARGPDDYSNFHEVFDLRGWSTLRKYLSHPTIRLELDRFVSKHDRPSYWRAFEGGVP